MRSLAIQCWMMFAFASAAASAAVPPEFPSAPAWAGRGTYNWDGGWERVELGHPKDSPAPVLQLVRSTDDGLTWSAPKPLVTLPPDDGFGGIAVTPQADGSLQVFIVHQRRVGEGLRPAVDRFFDIWHLSSSPDRATWTTPRCVFEGYVGSISNAITLKNGRILLPLGNWVGGRAVGPPTGSNEVRVIYSDDRGKTFNASPARLVSPAPENYNGSNYGACEPAAIELNDGSVYMLMRTQTGELYESRSNDGITWSEAAPSQFYASTGPPAFLKLNDGRIVMMWNQCAMPAKANGVGFYAGRDALHAAIADPELKTWRGFREVYLDPTRDLTPPRRGDRGTAYPDLIATRDGGIAAVSGQGGRRALFYVDPDWLTATARSDDFSRGLAEWSVFLGFGPAKDWWRDRKVGARLVPHPDDANRQVLQVAHRDADGPDAAVWNFPAGVKGTLSFRARLEAGSAGGTVSLLDRFFDPNDPQAEAKAACVFRFGVNDADAAIALPAGRWVDVEIRWDQVGATIYVDGERRETQRDRRPTARPVNYARWRSAATAIDAAGFLIEHVDVKIEP